jgi:hypothetical protein
MLGGVLIGMSLTAWSASAWAAENGDGYEGGRGLITLEGPSGMFINPTSGTIPEKASTIQYCVFFPNNKSDVVGHGLMGAYGVTDELEVGLIGTYVDRDKGSSLNGGGPMIRYRITKDEKWPQTSVGGYSKFGDNAIEKYGLFGAAYKRFPIDEEGTLKSVGIHAGIKNLWLDSSLPEDSTFSGYFGGEFQFPLRLYLVGEVQTKDSDVNTHVPYAFGLQWRAHGIAISTAGIQNGNLEDPSFYFGIGYGHQF